MLTPRPQSKVTLSPISGQIEESQKVKNRRVFRVNRKTLIFLVFILFLTLYFHEIQYGCNSVGYYLSSFYYFCTIASKIGHVWQDKNNK